MNHQVNQYSWKGSKPINCAVYQGGMGLSVIMNAHAVSTYAWRCAFCACAIIRKKAPVCIKPTKTSRNTEKLKKHLLAGWLNRQACTICWPCKAMAHPSCAPRSE